MRSRLRIAGLALDVELRAAALPTCLQPFLAASDGAPALAIEIRTGAPLGDAAGLTLARDGERLRYAARGAHGDLDLSAREARVAIAGERGLLGFLRFALGVVLPREGGLLLHGAAVVRAGAGGEGGYLFLGESGAGKSTIAQLCAESGARVLGDEVVALVDRDDGPWVFGTPLGSRGGPSGHPDGAPCVLACALAHAVEPAFERLPPGDLLRALLARTISPSAEAEPRRLLETAVALAARIVGGRLGFRLSPDFWTVLPDL